MGRTTDRSNRRLTNDLTLTRQVASFAAIGIASTVAYVVLYSALRGVASAPLANLIALATTAVANTALNRRLTFGIRTRVGFLADQLAGLGAFGLALSITTGAIALLGLVAPDASRRTELVVLVLASVRRDGRPFHRPALLARSRRCDPGRGAQPIEGSHPMTTIAPPLHAPESTQRLRDPLSRIVLGSVDQAIWIRPAFLGMTAFATILYVWGLAVSGFANTYYSAAALAASQSWSAWFFGSFDAANFITVDKPPLGTMLIGLSVRLFGLSSWSILLPQALAGIATVVVLYWAVRRSFGPAAATIAGVAMAVTPVAVLIFRYNNPDAILTLLLVDRRGGTHPGARDGPPALGGARRDVRRSRVRRQVPPGVGGPAGVRADLCDRGAGRCPASRRRASRVAALTVLVSSLWWVVVVELIPTTLRPVHRRQHDRLAGPAPARLRRARADLRRQRAGGGGANFSGTPGCCACSTPSSAARSPGSSRSR